MTAIRRLRAVVIAPEPGDRYSFSTTMLRRFLSQGRGSDELNRIIRAELARREQLERARLS